MNSQILDMSKISQNTPADCLRLLLSCRMLTSSRYIMRFFIIILLVATSNLAAAVEIKINPGKYFNYYHIEFQLDPMQYTLNSKYGFTKRGQFAVFVPKEHFPIPAPNCRQNIIIRMPASFDAPLDKKRALYYSLLKSAKRRVVLELNPYIDVKNEHPLELELQYCNVFFRQKNDNYHDQL